MNGQHGMDSAEKSDKDMVPLMVAEGKSNCLLSDEEGVNQGLEAHRPNKRELLAVLLPDNRSHFNGVSVYDDCAFEQDF